MLALADGIGSILSIAESLHLLRHPVSASIGRGAGREVLPTYHSVHSWVALVGSHYNSSWIDIDSPDMPTAIIGAGIIGVSTAYYLSQSQAEEIHLIEASQELFASASGFAAGFLAADWFAPALSRLGQCSFDLHKQLAEENDGHNQWGYSRSTGTSFAEAAARKYGGDGADWLMEGVSRATAAENTAPGSGHAPAWLQSKGSLDVLSNGETTAQMYVNRITEKIHDLTTVSQQPSSPVRLPSFLLPFPRCAGTSAGPPSLCYFLPSGGTVRSHNL